MAMMSSPNAVAVRTSSEELKTSSSRSAGVSERPKAWERSLIRRTAFSTMMTAPSTSRPKSIAPSDIRFPDKPVARIPRKATNIESGIRLATTRPARRFRRNRKRTTMTRMPPSARFLATVVMVLRIRSVRS